MGWPRIKLNIITWILFRAMHCQNIKMTRAPVLNSAKSTGESGSISSFHQDRTENSPALSVCGRQVWKWMKQNEGSARPICQLVASGLKLKTEKKQSRSQWGLWPWGDVCTSTSRTVSCASGRLCTWTLRPGFGWSTVQMVFTACTSHGFFLLSLSDLLLPRRPPRVSSACVTFAPAVCQAPEKPGAHGVAKVDLDTSGTT